MKYINNKISLQIVFKIINILELTLIIIVLNNVLFVMFNMINFNTI